MKLNELTIGSTAKIKVTKDKNSMEFDTIVADVCEKSLGIFSGLFVPLIRVDDKVLSFNNCTLEFLVVNAEDNREYKFHITQMSRQEYKGESYYILLSADDIKPINHREAVRVEYCEDCILQIGANKKALECFVRDISVTGISFAFPIGEFKYRIGDAVSAQFKIGENPIKVSAQVVRSFIDDEAQREIIGCTLSRPYHPINKLVYKLQTRNKT